MLWEEVVRRRRLFRSACREKFGLIACSISKRFFISFWRKILRRLVLRLAVLLLLLLLFLIKHVIRSGRKLFQKHLFLNFKLTSANTLLKFLKAWYILLVERLAEIRGCFASKIKFVLNFERKINKFRLQDRNFYFLVHSN